MKKLHYILMFALVCLVFGCAATISKDMQLSEQGFEYLNKGNYVEAEKYYDQALAENPNNPYAILNLGVIYQNTKRIPKAKEMYQKVIKLNPTDIVAKSNKEGAAGKTLVDLAKDNLKSLR
ncbi:MAG: tetratricopeptide repeat protein [Syntrophales bacterium]|nr:tetratricopeptide repeat protein [Syntrophales bacterium]